jgi:hypothetical protein
MLVSPPALPDPPALVPAIAAGAPAPAFGLPAALPVAPAEPAGACAAVEQAMAMKHRVPVEMRWVDFMG